MGKDLSVTIATEVRLERRHSLYAEYAKHRVTAAFDANLMILLLTRFNSNDNFLRIGSM
jgi:hypothetical protein